MTPSLIAGAEFFLSGALIALTLVIWDHLHKINAEISRDTKRYMGRIMGFLTGLSLWWLGSRLFILGYHSQSLRLNIGRSVFVLWQLWAEYGLLRFLQRRKG